MKLTLEQIVRWSAGEIPPGTSPGALSSTAATGYSIDSRTLQPGNLFIAIRGERFDGHDFIATAFERGACAAIVGRETLAKLPESARKRFLIAADDPLAALQRLAAAVRRHWGRRVIGITGSAGKTTTKEAIAAVLATRFKVLKSQGNLNNHYGLPLQLLRLEPEDEASVIEMGMSAAGEIAALCRIAAPDWGVVTNVGHAHAEFFPDGVAGIARAKYELVEALPRNGVAFLNCDDPYVGQFGRDFRGRVIYFGRGPCADPRVESTASLGAEGLSLQVRAGDHHCRLHLHLPGTHNAANALAAIAVGVEAGIPLEECCRALEALRPEDKRGQVITLRGATLLNDAYNSNPEALQSMIATLRSMPAQRRILVAGEMLELGQEAAALHEACGRAAAQAGIDIVLGVRGLAQHIVQAARAAGVEAIFLETPEQAGAWLRDRLQPGDAVLLKASRGVRLERVLDALVSSQKDSGPEQSAV
ncbi:MAG TPA: UDP-N-acetylmuramoyl-tripeptide--D-alanyl-D-alanine ligase [Acidobacteriaceae bacterium]|jgi:UDP-N-acetylmuramoyl-tripeptide--D-alanyl-D-alanine ligase|nr:UDP-N-acetylmuramoyl-tripeptide--D-alanyl-D-alanine ligase [Acidobacteriaceae bacterium]